MGPQNSPKVPHEGHPSISQELSTKGMASKQQKPNSHKQPPTMGSESRFCPIETAGAESQDTHLSRITALPSPTPSGEAESPLVITTQPSAARTKASATEAAPATSGAVGSLIKTPTDSSKRFAVPAGTHAVIRTSAPENFGVGKQAAASQARCEQWIAQLDSYISHREGNLESAEKLRLQFLKAVLSVGDELCVVVHGFVVLWVLDANRCAEILRLSRAVVDSACETLDIVFRGIRSLKNDLLARLVNFPPGLKNGDLHPSSAVDVSRVFQRLASSWNGILRDHLKKRQIPLRHRELVGVLQLRSQNLRLTLFRWSLSFLGVHGIPENEDVISILEEKFTEDQDFYLDQSRSKEEYESHDEKMAVALEMLLSATKRGPLEAVSPQTGSVTQAPVKGHQPRPPKQPQNQPPEQPRKRRRTQSLEEPQDNFESTQEYQKRQVQLQQQQLQQLQHLLKLQLQDQSTQQQQQQHPQHPIQTRQLQHALQSQQQQNAHQMQQYQHQNLHPDQTQPQGHARPLPTQVQGLSDAQWHDLEQGTLVQERLMQQAQQVQQGQKNQRRVLLQQQQQGMHIQTQPYCYPTNSGTWTPSPTNAVFSPVQGQPGLAQSSASLPGYGQQPQIRGPTPVTLSMGPGGTIYQNIPALAQVPQHNRGTAIPISNPATPTESSPTPQPLPMGQRPQRGAPHHHVQSHPGSTVLSGQNAPIPRQHGKYVEVTFAPNLPNAATLQSGGCGRAPAQNHSNLPPSGQPRQSQGVYHQYIDSLLSGPTRLPTTARRIKFEFDITDADFKRLSKCTTSPDGKSVLWSVFEGCRRVRFRVCTRPVSESEHCPAFPEDKWVGASTAWPGSLTVKVNEDGFVDIPRKRRAGVEVPCDIATHLRPGRNVVSVAVVSTAPPGTEFYGAVEMLDTQTQSSIMENVVWKRSLSETETINLINSRLAVDDDDIQVVDPEIYVSVTDPLSGSLAGLPCRGDTCSHLDIFDLRALLESRRPKRCPHGGVRAACSSCIANPQAWPDVPSADTWTCPICGGDARPGHLVVDKFLQGIVGRLATDAKEGGFAQAVYVDGNGRWRAKALGKEKEEEREVVMIDD